MGEVEPFQLYELHLRGPFLSFFRGLKMMDLENDYAFDLRMNFCHNYNVVLLELSENLSLCQDSAMSLDLNCDMFARYFHASRMALIFSVRLACFQVRH
jgi:hypothetical protein